MWWFCNMLGLNAELDPTLSLGVGEKIRISLTMKYQIRPFVQDMKKAYQACFVSVTSHDLRKLNVGRFTIRAWWLHDYSKSFVQKTKAQQIRGYANKSLLDLPSEVVEFSLPRVAKQMGFLGESPKTTGTYAMLRRYLEFWRFWIQWGFVLFLRYHSIDPGALLGLGLTPLLFRVYNITRKIAATGSNSLWFCHSDCCFKWCQIWQAARLYPHPGCHKKDATGPESPAMLF